MGWQVFVETLLDCGRVQNTVYPLCHTRINKFSVTINALAPPPSFVRQLIIHSPFLIVLVTETTSIRIPLYNQVCEPCVENAKVLILLSVKIEFWYRVTGSVQFWELIFETHLQTARDADPVPYPAVQCSVSVNILTDPEPWIRKTELRIRIGEASWLRIRSDPNPSSLFCGHWKKC